MSTTTSAEVVGLGHPADGTESIAVAVRPGTARSKVGTWGHAVELHTSTTSNAPNPVPRSIRSKSGRSFSDHADCRSL